MLPSAFSRRTMLNFEHSSALARDSPRGTVRRGFRGDRSRRASTASETMSRLCGSIAVCQPVLYSRLPATPASGRAASRPSRGPRAPAHLRFSVRTMPTQLLHHVLQVVLDSVGILAPALARRTARAPATRRSICWCVSMARRPCCLRVLRGELAGALAEDHQVARASCRRGGWRRASPRHASPAAKRPGTVRHLRVAVDLHAAHDVVRRRADFHRLLGDVEARQLL